MLLRCFILLCCCWLQSLTAQEVVAKLKDGGKWVSFVNLRASFDLETARPRETSTTAPIVLDSTTEVPIETTPERTNEATSSKKPHKIIPISAFRFSAVNQERRIIIVKTKKDESLQEITTTTTESSTTHKGDNKVHETTIESSTYSRYSEDDEDMGDFSGSGRIEEYIIPVATTTISTTTSEANTDYGKTEVSEETQVDTASQKDTTFTKLELVLEDEHDVQKTLAEQESLNVVTPEPDASDEVNMDPVAVENVIAVLKEETATRPEFEVLDEFAVPKQEPIEIKIVDHSSIDGALLDHEIMSVDVNKWNQTELRERLNDISLLEENGGERHRDLGSSFILPVLSAANYDNNTVPLAYLDIPVNVVVNLNVLYLSNFNSELMEYSIDVEMGLSWYDLRLANNYSKPVRIREKQILDQIWRPDPYFVNSKHSYLHKVSFPNMRMIVYPDGLVKYTIRATSICDCFMLFCLYPHDRQTCDMKISSIAYPSSYVRFHWHSDPIHFQSEFALPELHIEEIRTEECLVPGKLLRSSCVRLVFELERDGSRFLVEKYIPSTLAMMFAWVAPHVPYNYEEVRIVTPITVLLTLVQMEKGDQEIRTSYLTSMDIWFAAMKMFTVLSLVESLTVLALIKQSRAMEKNAQKAANELYRLNFEKEARRLKRLYHNLDAVCRVMSPVVFIIFFAYYVLFVAQGNENRCLKRN